MKLAKRLLFDFAGLSAELRGSAKYPNSYLGFNFHAVSNDYLPHVANISSYLSANQFENCIEAICRDFKLVSRAEMAAFIAGEAPLPRGKAFFTFDDGLSVCLGPVLSVMEKREIPAVFFIPTDFLDNKSLFQRHAVSLIIGKAREVYRSDRTQFENALTRLGFSPKAITFSEFANRLSGCRNSVEIEAAREAFEVDTEAFLSRERPYLSAEQARSLSDHGFFAGAHSLDHSDLSALPREGVERQIIKSCEIIAGIVGSKPVPFAFPHSSLGLDRGHLAAIARKCNYVGPFFDSLSRFNPSPFGVPRFDIDPFAEFAEKKDFPQRIISYFDIITWRKRRFCDDNSRKKPSA